MGFFKDIGLDVHAHALATLFIKLREEQFSCILNNVEQVAGEQVRADRRNLRGEADLSLKAFQYLKLMTFAKQHGYVAPKDFDKFNGMAMKHGWNNEREAVSELMREFATYQDNPVEQVVHVAIPIADYMLDGRKDPRVWTVIGPTLSAFSIQTEIMIANEFGDQQTAHESQIQLEVLCQAFEGRG